MEEKVLDLNLLEQGSGGTDVEISESKCKWNQWRGWKFCSNYGKRSHKCIHEYLGGFEKEWQCDFCKVHWKTRFGDIDQDSFRYE